MFDQHVNSKCKRCIRTSHITPLSERHQGNSQLKLRSHRNEPCAHRRTHLSTRTTPKGLTALTVRCASGYGVNLICGRPARRTRQYGSLSGPPRSRATT